MRSKCLPREFWGCNTIEVQHEPTCCCGLQWSFSWHHGVRFRRLGSWEPLRSLKDAASRRLALLSCCFQRTRTAVLLSSCSAESQPTPPPSSLPPSSVGSGCRAATQPPKWPPPKRPPPKSPPSKSQPLRSPTNWLQAPAAKATAPATTTKAPAAGQEEPASSATAKGATAATEEVSRRNTQKGPMALANYNRLQLGDPGLSNPLLSHPALQAYPAQVAARSPFAAQPATARPSRHGCLHWIYAGRHRGDV